MIERYTRTVMNEIWSEKTKFESMLEVELACLEAYVNEGLISINEYNEIRTKAKVDVKRIKEIEKQTKHDVIAFTTAVCENMGSEKRWFHYGLTSTDIVDSGEGLQIKKANRILSDDICKLLSVLREKAEKYKNTLCVGRTHGQHAEVTSFGLKWLLWYDELNRAYDRFNEEIKNVEVIKISGAVGNYADINPSIEKYVSEKLNMKCSNISTQVLSRDRHIGYINSLVMISSLLEKISMEIRHLSRTEIGEVSEQFAATQKGSSAMPHKKNPIASENICGCNRLMKSYLNVAYDDNPLWDERDISHSSAERVILVDATTLLDYMLTRYTAVLENLVVNENKMLENLNMTNGVIYSSKVLLKLVSKGMLRQNAYDILQRLSFESLNKKVSLRKAIEESELKDVLTKEDLDSCFNPSEALMHIDEIYKKVFTPKAKTLVVLGSGWGDEGKGKITNYLSEQSDYVVRFQGGDNAGHTIKFNGKTYKLNNQNKFNFRNNEINVAFWLINTIGGKVELRFEICEDNYISSADYNFLSEPLDLKEIKRGASKYSFGHNVTKQAKSFIMDVTNNSNMTDELINANLENAFNYKQDLNYIIVKRDNDLLGIYKRK